MRKWLKRLAVLSFLAFAFIGMTGCSNKDYDFYKDWHDAGATIEEENIFEMISKEEAIAKKQNANEVFVLVYATTQPKTGTNSTAVNMISSLQAQAEYLNNTTAKIYYLNATDDQNNKESRKSLRESLGMSDTPTDGSPVLMIFNKKTLELDTSSKSGDKGTKASQFYKDGTYQYGSIYSYIFKELLK